MDSKLNGKHYTSLSKVLRYADLKLLTHFTKVGKYDDNDNESTGVARKLTIVLAVLFINLK